MLRPMRRDTDTGKSMALKLENSVGSRGKGLTCIRTAILTGVLSIFHQPAVADMTDTEFEERLRTYLLANPEIIIEAMEALSEREARATQSRQIAKYPDLFDQSPILGIGPEQAQLTVIEFFDYRCAPCKVLHPKLQTALEMHPDIRVEMRHLPILSPGSERGARFALAVKNIGTAEQYRAVHDALWTLKGPLGETAFETIASSQGIDWPSVQNEMKSDAVSARIDNNRDIAIDLQILGTPAFVTPTSVSFGSTDAEALVADWVSQ